MRLVCHEFAVGIQAPWQATDMSDLNVKAKRQVMLTGAGFTHNFGGPLASGMWSQIFNSTRLRLHKRILESLRNDEGFDFESVYDQVMNGDFTDSEKTGFGSAIQQAYEDLDSMLRNSQFGPGSPHPIHLTGLQEFIARFAGSTGEPPGFIFTLNQDLFLERYQYNPVNVPKPTTPGVRPPKDVRWFSTEFRQRVDNSNVATLLDPKETVDQVKDDIQKARWCYLKLHGSYGWRRPDGTVPFVIGRDKLNAIFADPLLKLYFEIFEEVLEQDDRRLLIIGYGFRDEHINAALAKAIKDHGLELYILCPTEPARFKDMLQKVKCGNELWKGLHGYFPFTLRQLFPENQEKALPAKRLRDSLFGWD